MKLLIIHLSDLHLKPNENPALERKELISKAFQNLSLEADISFMVISGDIASSGKEDEYNQAIEFIDSIRDHIQKYSGEELNCLIIPGNHDCDHQLDKTLIRETLITKIHEDKSEAIDDGVIEQCCEVQSSFFDFVTCYQDNENILHSDKLLKIYEYKIGDINIIFNCYNTSWMSQLGEQPGKMYFPVERYPEEYLYYKSDLSISILHHTFNWHNCVNSRELMNHLEKTSDIILTGHEHVSSKSLKDDLEGSYTEYVEGGVLQDQTNDKISEFNSIEIDFKNDRQQIKTFIWNGEIYSLSNEVSTSFINNRYRRLKKKIFEINDKFGEKINDPGASFTHPYKSKLFLEDFFVFPNLRLLNVDKYENKYSLDRILNSKTLLKLNEDKNKILLVGEAKSGKTALFHILFRYYYNKHYVPIYIDGFNIKSTSFESFNKLVRKCFSEQYSSEKIGEFDQLENNRKVLFIDDFDKSKLNIKHRSSFLNNINGFYPNLIINANDLFHMENMIYKGDRQKFGFDDYNQYKIMEFGHSLRNKLIERWHILGKEEHIEENELIRITDRAQQIVNIIIGKNYVPSFPIFLLTILQTLEAHNPHNLRYSSYGYYYDVLITQALGRIDKKPEEIDAFYNYITELANHLFQNRIREISKDNLVKFHDWYCKEYAVRTSMEYYIVSLLEASILEENEDIYRFKYKYIFYFFVARYFSNNINQENIKEIITKLCKRLYRTEFSDIIMFLTYHSKDPFVLDEILNNAKTLFPEYSPINFEDDITAINELIDEMPKLVLENKDVREVREKALQDKDKEELFEEETDNEKEEYDIELDEDVKELDIISKLNLSFKTIEIIGQIMKNYYGSLKAHRKQALGEEAYFIGLRALKPFCESLEENKEYLVGIIKSMIEKENIVDKDKIEKLSKRLLFRICQMVIYAFIKKISVSIGSESLSETYKQIVAKNNLTSIHMVNLSIKLDFFRGFPYDDIKKMKAMLSNNLLPFTVLQQMVINYLYMFPTSYENRQKICSSLDIPMDDQRLISDQSTRKKRI